MTAPGFLPSCLPTASVGLRIPKFMAAENGPARASEGGKWRQAAGWQMAGGAAQGSTAAPLPVRRRPWSLPWGRLHKPTCTGPGLPLPLAPASPHPGAGIPALSPAACTVSSVSTGLVRGRAGHWDPPSHHWAPVLPHFAADSSPKQNRLSPFPPSSSLWLTAAF